MADLVCALALSHAPGLTGWLDRAPERQQRSLTDGFREIGRRFRAARPDVVIGLANDHVLNLPLDNTPDFCIGTAAEWRGPAEWFRDWLNVPDYRVAGHPETARTLVRETAAFGFRPAFSDALLFDDNWSVPLYYLTPDHDVALVPIHMNCIVPPLPAPEACYRFGAAVSEIVTDRLPAGLRVAFMATGGLSHDPGGPRYFDVDEAFDRRFLELMEAGDPQRLLAEATLERMAAAGDGGTTELLAWIAAVGVAGGRAARTICYEPAAELRCGMGGVIFENEAV